MLRMVKPASLRARAPSGPESDRQRGGGVELIRREVGRHERELEVAEDDLCAVEDGPDALERPAGAVGLHLVGDALVEGDVADGGEGDGGHGGGLSVGLGVL